MLHEFLPLLHEFSEVATFKTTARETQWVDFVTLSCPLLVTVVVVFGFVHCCYVLLLALG